MTYLFRWILLVIISLVSCFFLIFGIQILIAAYRLDNPFNFIMAFFSASLIILISAAILFGLIWRMVTNNKVDIDKEE